MANSTTILAFLTILLFLSSSSAAVGAATGGGHQLMWLPATAKASCRGTIGECMLGEEEYFEMDSESNRRILATGRYISYEALKRNHVPCSRRGASYYNCRRGAQANPYSRGCSAITRCRR